jgi:hypothetical protein
MPESKKVVVRYFGVSEAVFSLIREKCNDFDLPEWKNLPTDVELEKRFTHKSEKKKKPVPKKSKCLSDSKCNAGDSKKKVRPQKIKGLDNNLNCYSCGKELGNVVMKSSETGQKYCSVECMAYIEPDQGSGDSKLSENVKKKKKGNVGGNKDADENGK